MTRDLRLLRVGFTGVVHSIRLETVIAAAPGDCFGLSLSVDAHTASMRASGDCGTRMTDAVEFGSPLGPAGALADDLVLDRYLRQLLSKRNGWLKSTLEARG